jgi:hypothetical protein
MKKIFLTICLGTALFALTGMGNEPKCWNEWVGIKGAEDFVSAVQSGMVSNYYEEGYKAVPKRIDDILKSASVRGLDTEVVAHWILGKCFRPVDRVIACTLDAKLNEILKKVPTNLEICDYLYRYYSESKDVGALIEISLLLDAAPQIFQEAVDKLYQTIAPIMYAVGLGLYIPDKFMDIGK